MTQDAGWTQRGENVLIFGASGLGKTHIAAAIGYDLADPLTKLDKYAVLILDDLGYI